MQYIVSRSEGGIYTLDFYNLIAVLSFVCVIGTTAFNLTLDVEGATYLSHAAQTMDAVSALTSTILLLMIVYEWAGFGTVSKKISVTFGAMCIQMFQFMRMLVMIVAVFSFAFHILLRGVPENGYSTLWKSFLSSVCMMLGAFDLNVFIDVALGSRAVFATILFIM
jgi:hypothetical protein